MWCDTQWRAREDRQARVGAVSEICPAPVALTMRKLEPLHHMYILYTIGDCKWEEREKGNCLPQCGGGGFKEIYYVITQTAAGGGAECPNFVHENETVVLECCGEYQWVVI